MTHYTTSTFLLLVILALSLWYLWNTEDKEEVVEVNTQVTASQGEGKEEEEDVGEGKEEEEDVEEVDTSLDTTSLDTSGKDETVNPLQNDGDVDEEKGEVEGDRDDDGEETKGEVDEDKGEVDEEKGDDVEEGKGEDDDGSESEAESEASSDDDLEVIEYVQKLPPDATGKRARYRIPMSWFPDNDDDHDREDENYSPTGSLEGDLEGDS